MSNSIIQPEKESFFLVQFLNIVTDAVFAAFTTRDSDYSFEGVDYESETRTTIKLPRNDGTLGEEPCEIGLPADLEFAQDISSGLRYPATQVIVTEIILGDGAVSTTILRPFQGLMILARKKVGGRANTVTVRALSIKSRLGQIAMGLPCMQNCVNRLGDGQCKVNMAIEDRTLTNVNVLAINGPQITLSSAQIPSGKEDRFYQRGFISKDGFEFEIRDWRNEIEGDKAVFFLFRAPPASWLGQQVTVVSGCDKTTGTCDQRYAAIAQFKGAGAKMLPYNPLFEDGADRQ